jgi:ribosomal protein S17E
MGRVRTKTVKKVRVSMQTSKASPSHTYPPVTRLQISMIPPTPKNPKNGERKLPYVKPSPLNLPPAQASRIIIEKYYSRLTLDFATNKRIAEDVAIIPSKRLRNKIAGFT